VKGLKLKAYEIEISIDPELGSADSGDLESDLGELLLAIGDAAAIKELPSRSAWMNCSTWMRRN
jgi:hypothetical protein